jgi:uncharacterized membrane protein
MDTSINPGKTTQSHAHTHMEGFQHWIEGVHIQFPTFKHDHPAIINVNKVADQQLTRGAKIADTVASTVGSWPFIIVQSIALALWIILNIIAIIGRWDPYPFILLNLALSFQAAYAAPFVMMSQNRQSAKDRLMAESDYHCNVKGEEEIRNLMDHLDHQDTVILQILQRMDTQHKEVLLHLSQLDPELARRLGTDIQEVSKEIIKEETGSSGVGGNPSS